MTKKIFAMFLAVLMVVSMLPTSVFAAEATCPGKGSDNHTIENCEWEVVNVTEPTCGTVGYTSYKCKTCGDMFVDSKVEATGEHSMVPSKGQPATCGAWGWEGGMECENCSYIENATMLKPLHKEGTPCEWIDKTPNIDCTTGGEKLWECAACKATKTEKVAKGEHDFYAEDKNGNEVLNFELITPATPEAAGLGEVTCLDCGFTKEVDVFYEHDCVKVAVAGYPATCGTNGLKAHTECRICGKKYNAAGTKALTEKQIAELVITAEHDFECPETCNIHKDGKHEATCVDTVLHCAKCDKYIDVRDVVTHSYNEKKWDVQQVATCTKTGFATNTCENCGHAVITKILEATGHHSVTVSVPATCGTYAYTYTYCTRKGCVDGINPEVILADADLAAFIKSLKKDVVTPVTALAVSEEGFYLTMEQSKMGTTLYFAGTTTENDYQLATTNDISKAVKVYVEVVHPGQDNAYYLYFFNAEGVKTYIEIYQYDAGTYLSGSLKLTTEKPATYFHWVGEYTFTKNDEKKTITVNNLATTIYNETTETYYDYFLGSKDERNYISVFEVKYYAERHQAVLGVANGSALPNILSYEVFKKAGYNATAHVLSESVLINPTCTTEGSKLIVCAHCEYTAEVAIPATHKWEAMATVTVNGKVIPGYVAPSCVAGYRYEKCSGCDEVRKTDLPAYGHVMGETVKFVPTHINTAGYDYIPCKYCDHTVKTTLRTWTEASKHWDSVEEAVKGHGYAALTFVGTAKKGSCTEYGLDKYLCSGCGKTVLVKSVDEHGETGKHIAPKDTLRVEPTCDKDGGIATYVCERCDTIIGNQALGNGKLNPIAKLGHNWKENKDYKPAKCETPDYDAYTRYCDRCKIQESDGTKLIEEKTTTDYCTEYAYEYYMCHCGREHMRSFVTALDHEFAVIDANKDGKETITIIVDGAEVIVPAYVAPTCYAKGYEYFVCIYCGEYEKAELNTTEHVNKDNVKFTDKCTDTVEDRHCVVCHKVKNHAIYGNAHDCYTADANKDKKLDCLGECLIGKVCHPAIDKLVPSTCTTDAHELSVCADCGAETVKFSNLGWNGHKPAEADKDAEGNYIKFANYIYREYEWTHVIVVYNEAGEAVGFKAETEKYLAKFYEFEEQTYSKDGYFVADCQECKMKVTQVLEANEGLGIELNVANGNGAKEFTYGSLVEVVVTANGLEEAVYGFDFALNFTEGLVYVGYESLNNNFIFTIPNPKAVENNSMKFVAIAENDAAGKMQNVEINESTEMVKLFFRVTAENATTMKFTFANAVATQIKNNKISNTVCKFEEETIETRTFLDFNGKGFSINDLYLAMTLLTGEHPTGATYDVTVDVNKDGEVTLEDLSLAYNCYVGNMDKTDLLVLGMSDAEIELMNLNKVTICNNSACQKEIDSNDTYCPYCGNHQ